MDKSFNCPACGSDRIQKARILRRAGIPISSEVARKISPPAEPTSATEPTGWLAIYIGSFLLLIGVLTLSTTHTVLADRIGLLLQATGGVVILLGISLWGWSQVELNGKKPKYREDCAKWERLWYCSHCRNTFYDV